jgi:hypothetical protein
VRMAALRKDIRGVLTAMLDYSYPNLIRLSWSQNARKRSCVSLVQTPTGELMVAVCSPLVRSVMVA